MVQSGSLPGSISRSSTSVSLGAALVRKAGLIGVSGMIGCCGGESSGLGCWPPSGHSWWIQSLPYHFHGGSTHEEESVTITL